MFGIKLIVLRSELNDPTFWIYTDATFFGMGFFYNLVIIDSTDISKISSDHHRSFFDASLYPLSFFANTSFKGTVVNQKLYSIDWNYAFSRIHALLKKSYHCIRLIYKSEESTRHRSKNIFFVENIVMISRTGCLSCLILKRLIKNRIRQSYYSKIDFKV